jgi:GTP cyclohydrolase II
MENNWKNKSLQNLERIKFASTKVGSNLIMQVYSLYQKPLNDFSIEDLRLMIGQEMGLEYLVPLAIEVLAKNIFAEGDLYEGDLLQSVLSIQALFWQNH